MRVRGVLLAGLLGPLLAGAASARAVTDMAPSKPAGHLLVSWSVSGPQDTSQYRLELTDLTGAHPRRLPVPRGLRPTGISPDQRTLVFLPNTYPDGGVVLTDLSGHHRRAVRAPGCTVGPPTWSRDGRRLYFTAACHGNSRFAWADTSTLRVRWGGTDPSGGDSVPGPNGLAAALVTTGPTTTDCTDQAVTGFCYDHAPQVIQLVRMSDGRVVWTYLKPRLDKYPGPTLVTWTSDGFTILVDYITSLSGSGGVLGSTLLRINRKTGAEKTLSGCGGDPSLIGNTPDGRFVLSECDSPFVAAAGHSYTGPGLFAYPYSGHGASVRLDTKRLPSNAFILSVTR